MAYSDLLISNLADAILLGELSPDGICLSLSKTLQLPAKRFVPLAKEIEEWIDFKHLGSQRRELLIEWLYESDALVELAIRQPLRIRNWPLQRPYVTVIKRPALIDRWQLPNFQDSAALAQWLNISEADLKWYARYWRDDALKFQTRLAHYHLQFETKRSGELRLLEAPKARLKQIQRKLLSELLCKIPQHAAAHGFIAGKSTQTFVQAHIAQAVVVKMDLRHFFLSISSGRVQRIFECLGYSREISACLKGLCTTNTHPAALKKINCPRLNQLYRQEHLPQGAPTSPVIANLAAFNLDARLHGLAKKMGFCYSRYADDLAFSSANYDANAVSGLIKNVVKIAASEGFEIHPQKTNVMTQARAQSLVGLVLNEKQNIQRETFKLFEAELYNCVRLGAASQNRLGEENYRAHLQGKLAYFIQINPARALKLVSLFDQINW